MCAALKNVSYTPAVLSVLWNAYYLFKKFLWQQATFKCNTVTKKYPNWVAHKIKHNGHQNCFETLLKMTRKQNF